MYCFGFSIDSLCSKVRASIRFWTFSISVFSWEKRSRIFFACICIVVKVGSVISSLLIWTLASNKISLTIFSWSSISPKRTKNSLLIFDSIWSKVANFDLYLLWMTSVSSFISPFSETISANALIRRRVSPFSLMNLCAWSLHFGI